MSTIADTLSKAADLLTPEGAWTQHHFISDDGGRCLVSAISQAAMGDCSRHLRQMGFLSLSSATRWNDNFDRTQSEVVSALRKASELAREQGL